MPFLNLSVKKCYSQGCPGRIKWAFAMFLYAPNGDGSAAMCFFLSARAYKQDVFVEFICPHAENER